MDWVEITVHTTTEGLDIVSQALIDAGTTGVSIEDKNDFNENQRAPGQWDLIDEQVLINMPEDVLVHGYFGDDERIRDTVSQLEAHFRQVRAMELPFDVGTLKCDIKTVHDQDWSENWKKYYKPFRAGKHLVVKPSWEHYEAQPGDRVIEIDPGMAFGTGTHETTGMCVELVEKYVKPGDRVIDVGTGTGILAIAAKLSGAGDTFATDIDHVAVRVADENTRRNGQQVTVRHGDLLSAVDEGAQFDVAIANIIADVVISLAGQIGTVLRPEGTFICSGIIREREQDVLDALERDGYEVCEVRRRGEWVAICSKRVG